MTMGEIVITRKYTYHIVYTQKTEPNQIVQASTIKISGTAQTEDLELF